MIGWLKSFFARQPLVPPTAAAPAKRRAIRVSPILMDSMREPEREPIRLEPPKPPPGVVPQNAPKLAMDDASSPVYDYVNSGLYYGDQTFLSYPRLVQLSQRPEYRMISETLAKEMTRKWAKLVATGDDKVNRDRKIKDLTADMQKFGIQSLFRNAIEHDGFFGRAQIYIDVKTASGVAVKDLPEELKKPLPRVPEKIAKGSLLGFRLIEAMWTYPARYDSLNPLSEHYYRPQSWYVMAKEVHADRMLFFCARPVADMLKPMYSFGGLSMTQLAEPYVENWIRTRDSVGDIVHSFSLTGLATDNLLSSLAQPENPDGVGDLMGGMDSLMARVGFLNRLKDNRDTVLIDKQTEEFFQFNTPLSGLDKLQAQAQEQMASVSHIPTMILLGLSPTGLNASSDGEVRTFYAWIASNQVDVMDAPFRAVLELLQLNRYGEIDPDIGFEWPPLWEMDDTDLAQIRKSDADADAVYVTNGVIRPEESRRRLATDPTSGYNTLDADDVPDPPAMPGLRDDPDDSGEPGGSGKPGKRDDPGATGDDS